MRLSASGDILIYGMVAHEYKTGQILLEKKKEKRKCQFSWVNPLTKDIIIKGKLNQGSSAATDRVEMSIQRYK